LDVVLIGLSLFRFQSSLLVNSEGWIGLGGDFLALAGSLAAVRWGVNNDPNSEDFRIGLYFAGIATIIFACQFLLEYLGSLTSNQDGILANYTFGGLLILFLVGGLVNGYRQRSVRAGLFVGFWSGIFYSLAWVGLLWITFHLFAGTVQEAHFFEIDQTLVDFQSSGMSDLRAFVVQDYLGATFFHPVLGILGGCLLGSLGGFLGKTAANWRYRKTG
jgi:hypothetical protein